MPAVTYRAAGVDIEAADSWLHRMKPLIRSTLRPGVMPDRGQFAGLFRLAGTQLRDPVLVASTDGVGTKLKVAQLARMHDGIGIDAVAMNTNDVVTYGAEPLFFLDYLAVGHMQPRLMSVLLKGVIEGCRQSGCALLGGETAEMPGVYREGEYDIAGFCVGIADRAKLIDGSRVRAGDTIVGLASSGVHANGFSLVRKVLTTTQLLRHKRALLAPTRIYVKPVLQALKQIPIRAIAHVTGGGLSRRIPSLVAGRSGLQAVLGPRRWRMPQIFQAIQAAGQLTIEEMQATFNMGIGMAMVTPRQDAGRLIRLMERASVSAWSIGTVERA